MATSASWVNLDGLLLPTETAQFSVLNHGLLYGDGLFETLRWLDGSLFRPEAHLSRLRNSARELDLEVPWSDAELLAALRDTACRSELQTGALRLTVTRGEGPPVPSPSVCGAPHFLVTMRPHAPLDTESWRCGLSLCVAGPHPRPGRPGMKSLSYLPFQEARRSALKRGFHDGLLVHGEWVVETGISNLFLVRDGALLTPPLESGCLPGIARAVTLELARAEGLPVEERAVSLEELRSASEVFATNALQTVMPVTRFEEREWRVGTVTQTLAAAYAECVRRETGAAG